MQVRLRYDRNDRPARSGAFAISAPADPIPLADIEFRPYRSDRPEDAAAFRTLNEAWITRYFVLEEEDRLTLHDPENHVLAPGGAIFMACLRGEPVGCCALIPSCSEPQVYELAKMAIDERLRGRGIGRLLILYVLDRARELGARRLTLESNSALANAVHLYELVGFRHLPAERVGASPYARADVHMELILAAGPEN